MSAAGTNGGHAVSKRLRGRSLLSPGRVTRAKKSRQKSKAVHLFRFGTQVASDRYEVQTGS
jgi:hypothetical protein